MVCVRWGGNSDIGGGAGDEGGSDGGGDRG